jgi:8-oxo-dGTP pyrophosphatase MutT (NUDIX family)
MHRKSLVQKLKRYHAVDAEQQAVKVRMLNFIEGHEDCFDRELALGHMTASAWLTNATGDQVLLTHHKKLNKWLQLGGHADGDADLLNVAIREAQEESGVPAIEPVSTDIFDIDIHPIPARLNEPQHDHFDVRFWLRVTDPKAVYIVGDESHDLRWFSVTMLNTMDLDASIGRMTRKWIEKIGKIC